MEVAAKRAGGWRKPVRKRGLPSLELPGGTHRPSRFGVCLRKGKAGFSLLYGERVAVARPPGALSPRHKVVRACGRRTGMSVSPCL